MSNEILVYGGGNIQGRSEEAKSFLSDSSSPEPDATLRLKPPAVQGRDKIKTYKWRWVVLALFSLNNAVANYIWIMSAIVANVMECYYGVSATMVNLLTTSYMMIYVVLIWPVAWAMDRYGLQKLSVVASATIALGAALRIAGTSPQYYWLILLGQFTAGFSNAIFFGGGPLLSETWFPSSERATATAISGAMSPQMGILIALGVTPMVIHSDLTDRVCQANSTQNASQSPYFSAWTEEIYPRWLYYQIAVAGVAVVTMLLTMIAFRNAPPTPPSLSRKLESEQHQSQHSIGLSEQLIKYVKSYALFFKNGYFVMFLITSGIFLATAGAIVSIINEIVEPYFPDKDEEIGYLGVVAEVATIFAMLVVGRILDWTKSYYFMSVLLSMLGAASTAALVVLIMYQKHFYLLYPAVALTGLSLTAFQALAYEYAIEMTYPLPESTSAGLINIVSQIIAVAQILLVTPQHKVLAMWFVVGVTAFGALLSVFIRPKLRRVEIDKQS